MIRLSILGLVDLRAAAGTRLDTLVGSSKRFAVLVYLAAARPGEMLRRDRLVGAFWPEVDDRRARSALNQTLHVLRQSLGPGVIVSRGSEEVGVDPDALWCDATAFQAAIDAGRLEEALELYRGDLLENFFVESSRGFEEWMENERARLQLAAAKAARTLAERHEQERHYTIAVGYARRAYGFAGLDERALRRYLELLERVGDVATALRVYEEFARRFEIEWEGGSPSAETQRLVERLRAARSEAARPKKPAKRSRWAVQHDGEWSAPLPFERSTDREDDAGTGSAAAVETPRPAYPPYSPIADGPASAEIVELTLPPVIDGYTIIDEIGRGGSAIVYRARDEKHGRMVAIKVLKPELAASIQAERFLREIRIIATLSHPHILTLLDSGRVGGMLYYITSYVAGESLRQRLESKGALEIAEAIRIVCEVAHALDCAHRSGIVHRDVKPENILLADGHVYVADFGIARAMDLLADTRLTLLRAGIGTPAYMSPEQANGDGGIDGRADIYSLGCVLFELLTGEPPYTGTAATVIAKHAAAPVPSVRVVRSRVPEELQQVIETSLQKMPVDRFATAAEFAEALEGISTRVPKPSKAAPRVARAAALAACTLFAFGAGVPLASGGENREVEHAGEMAGLDSLRFAVFPPDSEALAMNAALLLRDELVRWRGITVADAYRVDEALRGRGQGGLDASAARRIAANLRAGRYVRVRASALGDSVRFDVVMYDTRRNLPVAEVSANASADAGGARLVMQVIVEKLFLGGPIPRERGMPGSISTSYLARMAFARGQTAIERWDLALADSSFAAAADDDAEYGQAHLWLALVRYWMGTEPAQWQFAAERAAAAQGRLHAFDRLAVEALHAAARSDLEHACAAWRRLTQRDSLDFSFWYSLGHCLRTDPIVVPDGRSPSGWAFRTSYGAALDAYERAFRLLPASNRSYRGGYFEQGRKLFVVGSDELRTGRSRPPERLTFSAFPEWNGDSLAFVPYPDQRIAGGEVVGSDASNLAVLHQRLRFHRATTMWRAARPESAEALEAVAATLDLLGNTAALDSLRLARRLAGAKDDRLGMAALEVWIRLKHGVPRDLTSLGIAARLADSVISAHRPRSAREAEIVANLASLLGRAEVAARCARQAMVHQVHPSLSEAAPTLLAFAALGGPGDELERLEREVERALRTHIIEAQRLQARQSWLLHPALLAVPNRAFASVPGDTSSISLREQLLGAWRLGDLGAARRILNRVHEGRQRANVSASDLTLDILRMEAAVLRALGDPGGAHAWLTPTLDSLSAAAPQSIGALMRPGSLVRAMALRAELAHELGDAAEAREWARAVALLWASSDAFLRPTLLRMQSIAR